MLAVQVDYWNLQEKKRTNMANEKLRLAELHETTRHNYAVEAETNRHNVATERLGWASLQETVRHNMANEDIARDNIRLGYAQLDETRRHNYATEDIGYINADTARLNAKTNVYNALITRDYQLKQNALGIEANSIARMNAETNQQRATVDASIGWYNADTNRKNIELQQQKFEFQRVMDIWRNTIDTIGTAGKVVRDFSSMGSGNGSGTQTPISQRDQSLMFWNALEAQAAGAN